MTSGLLTQKSDTPAPVVGDVKPYVVSQLTAKSGKPWTKIKFDAQNGQLHKVLSVRKNDYQDQYGNVSYNLEIEPNESVLRHSNSTSNVKTPQGQSPNWDERSARIERQHSQEMALRYFALKNEVPTTEGLREMTSWFQRDIGRSPEKRVQPEPEPPGETVISDEPLPEDMVDQEF